MPLVLPNLAPPAAPSDSHLRSLEASTLALEIERLETSLAKLRESQELLLEFASAEDRSQDEREELKAVREENEGVISRQVNLLERLRAELEAKGGVEAAKSDPHVMAMRGGGAGANGNDGRSGDGDVDMR